MTEQRKKLIDFFENNRNMQFTVDEITQNIDSIPKSTTYRLIKNMTDEGILREFHKPGSRKLFYQIFNNKKCKRHFHLKCECCGKILHLDDNLSENLEKLILSKYDFNVDGSKTILFGNCENCKKQKGYINI